MRTLLPIQKILRKQQNVKHAQLLMRFFKTGAGEYAEGDKFLGLAVPATRAVAKANKNTPLTDVYTILKSEYHEERLLALCLMVIHYNAGDDKVRTQIYNQYLRHIAKYINNWDLVDLSSSQIVGQYLLTRPRAKLYSLLRSKNLWERRVAVISTFAFLKQNDFKDTLKICELLMNDQHDLIHKATGWALREVGKRNIKLLQTFLKQHASTMPRTMLRYSIEKFPPSVRQKYLNAKLKK